MKLDFGHALRDFLSKNQEAREFAAKTLLQESGERGAVDGVIAHHPQLGFRASVMAALAIPPRYATEAARYLGAWHGVLTQDPDLVAFTLGEGADRLHHLTAPLPPQELASHLRDAGILRFSLRPGEGTSTAHIYDKGGVYDLTPLAERLNGHVNYSVGSGRRLSEGAGSHAGGTPAAAYRSHIKRAESAAAAPPDADADRLRLARVNVGEQRYDIRTEARPRFSEKVTEMLGRPTRVASVQFARVRKNDGGFDFGVSGTGNAREVLRKVVAHIGRQLKKPDGPHLLHFDAEGGSRQKLYSHLVARLLGSLPGWTAHRLAAPGLSAAFVLAHPDVDTDKLHEVLRRYAAVQTTPEQLPVDPRPRKLARPTNREFATARAGTAARR